MGRPARPGVVGLRWRRALPLHEHGRLADGRGHLGLTLGFQVVRESVEAPSVWHEPIGRRPVGVRRHGEGGCEELANGTVGRSDPHLSEI